MDTSGLRRDGSPFINLCLVAPLYDNKGNVRYFIGCQVDVTNLIEGGKGLESFQLLLDQDLGAHEQYENPQKGSLKAIGGLGELLSSEEVDVLKHKSRDPTRNPNRNPNSTAQSRLLDRIGGPQSVREGIATAFAEGVRVTAKISWLTGSNAGWYSKDGAHDSHHPSRSNSMEGKPRYIHCTPLLGSDGVPGVWMVVMVENEDITGAINARRKRWGFSPVGPDTGVANSKFTQEKLFSQYRTREGGAHGAAGDGRARSRAESKVIADDNASTFFVDEEVPPPVSSIYAEYLANSAKRSASASRGPSRPPSRAPSRGTPSRGYASSPETPKKRQPRDEMVKMVRLPLPPDRLGEVVEQ
ncbi:PAS domain-containing protein [Neofusicoccum parvum]|uniref:Putative k+-channel erg-like protein n=1 Tax=Botryosphaeria parva (strain UCR-NP2) TaxID=1287680 RepID=R1EEB0_BOTPV|nr:putative k+-channel erg-like protein [Neofusicoccum parvum UCRNP2]GME59986.1 PAS domain-containing protein [Neofusicoccum parvum]